mmetsp:Transcript_13553/g.40981  ORF Transcript_13553/g.40981 Transcript_13553/m.40981 type:complete len:438 (+) Transcript_13553:118-1431(+)|eukprot:CAMPEP_0206149840 /NCGR_PEP_ID=MMETSP1473-20131121/37991_1 /ASSEMBLY_ACC=CAM_ASM_001109 /TAXON_ID=1461547 /ORGANISM="Stichococcus sp, Strain RCC1054" /LENGTH=437 /DNA_ID=CAMNT_0053547323 /DNA_START=579 /DNA_END=1892 /DNA_ORIENTATION=-
MPAPAASGRDDLEGADIPLLTDGLNGGPKRLSDITRSFGWMGWAAFGGPAAHVGLFQKVLVERLRWVSDGVHLELLALCQCLPGPTSTQLSFAMGVTQQGVPGGLLSGVLFQYPGAVMSALAGVGASRVLKDPPAWLHALTAAGLAAVGVALVASAAGGLARNTCKDRVTQAIATLAAVTIVMYQATWVFPLVIVLGGLVTLMHKRSEELPAVQDGSSDVWSLGVSRSTGLVLAVLWLTILIGGIVARHFLTWQVLHWWEAFFRTGSIIFGGGQVVLPMLQHEVVATGWMSQTDFLTGLALIQALPGPLFNLAAYVGAIIAANAGMPSIVGIITCWLGLFSPGVMMIFAVLPWWGTFRRFGTYRKMLPGINAAAVGLIIAAVFQLMFSVRDNSPAPLASTAIGIIGFCLVEFLGVAAPAAILVGAGLGVASWAAGMP